MRRYILAQEAEERIAGLYRKERGDAAKIFNTAIDACQSVILDMYDNSSEDVVPVKHGRWVNDNGLYKCSVCNTFTITGWANCIPIEQMNKTMQYCPHCGAKMDAEEGGEG